MFESLEAGCPVAWGMLSMQRALSSIPCEAKGLRKWLASPGFTRPHTGHLTGLFLGSVRSLSHALFHSHSVGVVLSSVSNLELVKSVQEEAEETQTL